MRTFATLATIAAALATSGCAADHTHPTGWFGLIRQPDPGYEWTLPNAPILSDVRWSPGTKSASYPHAQAGAKPDQWIADRGYAFADPDDPASIHWQPGLRPAGVSHAVSGVNEGSWTPDAGYRLVRVDDPASARWQAGLSDPAHPNIHSSQDEGRWLPDEGWAWVSASGDDLTVMRDPQAIALAERQPDLGQVIVHVMAQECAQPQQDDGFLGSLGRVSCAVIANATAN